MASAVLHAMTTPSSSLPPALTAHASWPRDIRDKVQQLHALRRPRDQDQGDDARQEVAVIYGFPELARSDAVVQSLEEILAVTNSPTAAILDRFAPYKRGNRGIIKFKSSLDRDCFLEVFRALPEGRQRPPLSGQGARGGAGEALGGEATERKTI